MARKTASLPSPQVLAAAREFVARRDRRTNPDGTFDSGGRWYPSDAEWQACCAYVRSPSRAWPYSYMTHCRTAAHVASLFGVDVSEVRKAARLLDKGEMAAAA